MNRIRTVVLRWMFAREMRARLADIEARIDTSVDRTRDELQHALTFINRRGLRDEYELYAATARRAAADRARGERP